MRGISAGVAATVLPQAAFPKAEERDDCRVHATRLAEAMMAKHGGYWRVSIDNNFVLISKSMVSLS